MSQMTMVMFLCRNHNPHFSHSRLTTGTLTIIPRRMPLMEQELPILHLTSAPVVSCSIFIFLRSVLQINVCSFCPFSLGHFIGCSSSIYVFWSSGYPLWYLQIFLTRLSRVQLFMLYIKVKMIILFEFVGRIDICWVERIGICRED